MTPLAIPASWRPAFAAIEKVRSCLINQGMRPLGGPVLGVPATEPGRPLGELLLVSGNAQIFIAFYENSGLATQSEPEVIQNAKRLGGGAERHGAVTVLWTHSPTSQERNAAEACALG